ncbi:hypothetical protein PFISCL1PPCAC_11100, partial [Pristionchus fissidentatus]
LLQILYLPCMLVLGRELHNSSCVKSLKTNCYLVICGLYGAMMMLFTRPVLVNSTHQSMFFSPFIHGHDAEEYVNYPHSIHNISVAIFSCIIYFLVCVVLFSKARSINSSNSRKKIINNTPIFFQVMLICAFNMIGTLIYVYMNFMPTPPAVIVLGQISWQLIHGSPPFIYIILNKSIRNFALKSVGL